MGENAADRSGLLTAASQLLYSVAEMVGHAGRSTIDELRKLLEQPSVVAVAGRVNVGKSTLVNGLVSMKVAPTSAQESTALLSYYQYGAPATAEAVMGTDRVVQVPIGPLGPVLEGIPLGDIEYLRQFFPAAVLQQFTVIDTPGLASASTGNSAKTELELLEDHHQLARPDIVFFLVRDTFRPDDEEFIGRLLASRSKSPTQLSPSIIGLLSHADNFGSGPWDSADPIEAARKAASALAAKMPQLVTVVPVAGLLAETVRTGALREDDVRALRRLRGADAVRLQFSEQLGPPVGTTIEDIRRLTRLIGAYGVRFGRDYCASSVELLAWLKERSGLVAVERVLNDAVAGPTERSKVGLVLAGLTAAARNEGWRPEARALIESAKHSSAFHRLREWEALDVLRAESPQHSLVTLLEDLVNSAVWPRALTPEREGTEAYLALAGHYQSMVGNAATGAEAQAVRVLARSVLIHSKESG
jgi:hypothetical protein